MRETRPVLVGAGFLAGDDAGTSIEGLLDLASSGCVGWVSKGD